MSVKSGISNCFTKNHIPIVFFNKPATIANFDVSKDHSPYLYLYASLDPATAAAAGAPLTIPMPSYEITAPTPITNEFNREIDFLSSLGLCAVEKKDDTTKYHIHTYAELFYGRNKLFRQFRTDISQSGAETLFADLKQLLYQYVLPGKYLSYKGQESEAPVELTYIIEAIASLE
jgi:hypothetical protein